jgi:hypothetical protein
MLIVEQLTVLQPQALAREAPLQQALHAQGMLHQRLDLRATSPMLIPSNSASSLT